MGYTGYLASEYCVAAVRNHRVAGVEEVDRGTSLALRYMKQLAARAAQSSHQGRPQPAVA